MIYQTIESLKLEDDKAYLETLVSALSTDSLFIGAYIDFQYNEVLPSLISIRMELDDMISTADKSSLQAIRKEVFQLYDDCLVTCIANKHHNTEILEELDELMIVALNKDLSDSESGLNKLIELTRKYEDDIHEVYIKHDKKFKDWDRKENEIKSQYILGDHSRSLNDLNKRNGLSTLKHLESEAIFMLLDPYNENISRKFLNLGLRNQL